MDLESIGFKILWSLTPIVVAAFGFLLRKSLGRTVKDIDGLIEADKVLHDRVTEAVKQLEHLQGEHDALCERHDRRKGKR